MKDPRRVVVVVDDDVAPLYPPLPSKPPRLQELAQTTLAAALPGATVFLAFSYIQFYCYKKSSQCNP